MDITTSRVTVQGIAALTQSRYHEIPKHKGELAQDYDRRTYLDRLHEKDDVVICPAAAFHQGLVAAAKYTKRQIPGQGKATWTAKFQAGVQINGPIVLHRDGKPITRKDVGFIDIYANADGVRGSGKRVMRRLPQIPSGWTATFDIVILDPIITKEVLEEFLNIAGMFIGIGQYRPANGGDNGRYAVQRLEWHEVHHDEKRP